MPVKCPACGADNQTGKFCGSCGSPLAQAAPAPGTPTPVAQPPRPPVAPTGIPGTPPPPGAPYGQPGAPYGQPGAPYGQPGTPPPPGAQPPMPPGGMPYTSAPGVPTMPRKSGGSSRWVIWLVVVLLLVAALVGGAFVLLNKSRDLVQAVLSENLPIPTAPVTPGKQGTPVPTPSKQSTPPTPTTDSAVIIPAQAKTTATLTPVAGGSFGDSEYFNLWATVDQYVAGGYGDTAVLWEIDPDGTANELARVTDSESGSLLDVTVGYFANNGTPAMVATFVDKLYVAAPGYDPTFIENPDIYQVLIGDYDGDGKDETIYMTKNSEGKYGFRAYRYNSGEDGKALYSRDGRSTEWPQLMQVEQQAGSKDMLYGWVEDEKGGYRFVRYSWDGALGPTPLNQYLIADVPDYDLYWLTAGYTPLGPTILAGRGSGDNTTLELITPTSLYTQALTLGKVSLGDGSRPAFLLGKFTGSDGQLMIVQDDGSYTIYDVARKN